MDCMLNAMAEMLRKKPLCANWTLQLNNDESEYNAFA